MFTDLIIYGTLAISSFLNIIVPISGSATVTPFLAILTDPHRAIGLASFYFVLSGIIRVFIFRKDIQWDEIKHLLPPSLMAGIVGSLALVVIEPKLLLIIVLCFTIYFLLKKVGLIKSKSSEGKKNRFTSWVVGLLSGFLQGAGLAGSDIRNSYLYARGLSISQLHGTTATVGASIFLTATFIRLGTGQLTIPDLLPLIYVFPFILIGTLIGRHVLYKMSKKLTDYIVVMVMITIIVFLFLKILQV